MVYFHVMAKEYYMVFNTCPDATIASEIATALVEKNVAACVNIVSGVRSIYRWEGKLETSEECLLLIKTRRDCYSALEEMILALHPYEVPEIIALPLEAGLAAYLGWIDAALETTDSGCK